jgi:DNA invertase Pin-like site-specific DNA recombinase
MLPGGRQSGGISCQQIVIRARFAREEVRDTNATTNRYRIRGERCHRKPSVGSLSRSHGSCSVFAPREQVVITSGEGAERVTTAHRAKLAYIYIRQSTAGQVRQHQESTELQYHLVDRAVTLGWPRERVTVIDDDLGKSGTSSAERHGFQRLISEIGLGKAGLVLSLDASRLARNNRDWHQLLELCSIFGVLIADGERLYEPTVYHDRLLLGLSGIMSEAELHQLRVRLHQGERQKAARGELRLPLPGGLAQTRTGEIILHPDEQVQARLEFVFHKFAELQSAKAVMRELRRHDLSLPVRPLRGPAPHEIEWVPATSSGVLQILHNPAYAGAYVYGRRQLDPIRRRAGQARPATVQLPVDRWPVCLKEAHPGYISWEEFMGNQTRLVNNCRRRKRDQPGVPRKGQALLQGIATCGRCGRRMGLHYSGPKGDYPVYVCTGDACEHGSPRCQQVRALSVDMQIEQVLLETLSAEQIDIAVEAVGEIESQVRLLEQQWRLKCERARYEVERARRQYDEVEPENRLVARSLEKAWEQKLRQQEEVEQAYQGWQREQAGPLSTAERAQVSRLAKDFTRVWRIANAVERKRIIRLVIRDVTLDQVPDRGLVSMRITWQTGATSEHHVQRRVQSYGVCVSTPVLERRLRELARAGKFDREIATILNEENIMSARGVPFQSNNVHVLRKRFAIRTAKINGIDDNPARWPDGTYSVRGAADALGVTTQTIFKWLRGGSLSGTQIRVGQPWKIKLTPEKMRVLRSRVRRINRSK